MLFKNHQKIALKQDPLYAKHKKEFEDLIKDKTSITVRTRDVVKINPTGYKEPDRIHTVPTQSIIANADDSDNDYWIYTEKAPKKEQNGEWKYSLEPIRIEREIAIATKDYEKLFFLMYLSTAAKNGRLVVVDEQKEERAQVDKLKNASRINFLIMDELSPVDEHTIRRVAKAFGVGDVDKKSLAKVKLELKATIDVANTNFDKFRNSDAFVVAINSGEEVDTRAQVQEALDSGRIKFNEVGSYYYYVSESDEEIKKIMNVDLLIANDKIRRLNALNNYFIVNPDKKKELARLMNYTVEDINWSIYSYGSLKQFAASIGVNSKCDGTELIKRVSEFFEANKESRTFDLSVLAVAPQKKEQTTE